MFHEFSFGGWGSLPLFVGISIPRQSKLSESKQLWDWPGLVMEPPSKKAQIPSFGHLFAISVWWFKKKRVDLHKMMQMFVGRKTQQIYIYIYITIPGVVFLHALACHFIASSIMRWCSHYDLQGKDEFLCESSKAGTLAAFRHFNGTMSRNYKCIQSTPPANRIRIWWFMMIYVNKKRFASVLLIWLLFPTDPRGWQFHRISHFHLNHTMSITPKSTSLMLERFCSPATGELGNYENATSYPHISMPAGRSKWPRATWINGPWMPGNEGSKLESNSAKALRFANLRVENTHFPIFHFGWT